MDALVAKGEPIKPMARLDGAVLRAGIRPKPDQDTELTKRTPDMKCRDISS